MKQVKRLFTLSFMASLLLVPVTKANDDPSQSVGFATYGYDACGNRISRTVQFDDDEDRLRSEENNADNPQSETLGDITVYPRVTTGIVNVVEYFSDASVNALGFVPYIGRAVSL